MKSEPLRPHPHGWAPPPQLRSLPPLCPDLFVWPATPSNGISGLTPASCPPSCYFGLTLGQEWAKSLLRGGGGYHMGWEPPGFHRKESAMFEDFCRVGS